MSDRELRELERRYLTSGDPQARERLARARFRAGELTEAAMRLAQDLQDPLAIEVLGPPTEPVHLGWLRKAARNLTDRIEHPGVPADVLEVERWVRTLEPHGAEAIAEAARCALEVARLSWAALDYGWAELGRAVRDSNPEEAAYNAGHCARVAALAVGPAAVRVAVVQGLTDWAWGLPAHRRAPAAVLPDAPGDPTSALTRFVDLTLHHVWTQASEVLLVHRSAGLTPALAVHERLREPFLVRVQFLAGLNPIRDSVAGRESRFEWVAGYRTDLDAKPLDLKLRMRSADEAELCFPSRDSGP